MFELFNWFIPSKTDFITAHQGAPINPQMKKLAEDFMTRLDDISLLFLAIALLAGIMGALFYYYFLNSFSGRMYKINKWVIVMFVTVLLSWAITIIAGFSLVSSLLKDTDAIIFLFTIPSLLWSFLAYFITSFLCCNVGKTNAYRFLAIHNR